MGTSSLNLWKKENGIYKVDKALLDSKATFVFGQMNEPPGARARVALSGLTVVSTLEMEG